MKEKQILNVLPGTVRRQVEREELRYDLLQEIRLRVGQPLILIYRGEERIPGQKRGRPYQVTREDIREMLEYVSNYSLYAYEEEMRQGFITIEGGHRIGMAGQAIMEEGKVKNLRYISSVNVRLSHEVLGCADPVFPHITANKRLFHTLIVSPPRCGKTTLLRDIVRQVSGGNQYVRGMSVGVVDERSEIGGCYQGVAQNHLGMRTDILDACPKAEGMLMLIRSMGPQVIAVDEIGTGEDVHAIEYAMHCGCKMLVTVHGESMEELKKKPLFGEMIAKKRFERYIVLGRKTRVGEVKGHSSLCGREPAVIRLAGAALVVGAAALMGEVKAGEVREQYTRLLGLQRVICSLQGEMGYARSHLGEIFARIGAQEEEPYKSWLLELSRELERRKSGTFHRIWEESIKRHLKDFRLPTRELDRLKSLGLELGSADLRLQLRTMELYLEQLTRTLEETREEMRTRVRLCRCLGVMGGIFVAVLLL